MSKGKLLTPHIIKQRHTLHGHYPNLQHTMMKSLALCLLAICSGSDVAAFSLSMGSESNVGKPDIGSRRSFLSSASAIVGGAAILSQQPQLSYAAPEILNTASGIKYAITKETKNKKPSVPLKGKLQFAIQI